MADLEGHNAGRALSHSEVRRLKSPLEEIFETGAPAGRRRADERRRCAGNAIAAGAACLLFSAEREGFAHEIVDVAELAITVRWREWLTRSTSVQRRQSYSIGGKLSRITKGVRYDENSDSRVA